MSKPRKNKSCTHQWLIDAINDEKAYRKKHKIPYEKHQQIKKSGPVIHLDAKTLEPKCDPNLNAFLKTYEWRKVRMEALKLYGNKCQCCGATPKDGIVLHVDHIKPRRYFPGLALDIKNLQILCEVCNHGKGNWDSTDWR